MFFFVRMPYCHILQRVRNKKQANAMRDVAQCFYFAYFRVVMNTVYLVRHGETQENVAQILQGHMPGHLTELGIAQAEALRDALKKLGVPFDALVVSDLGRTLHTARIVNGALHLPLHATPLLRERDWGSLTGVPIADVQGRDFPDDVESVEAMFARARRFLIYIKECFAGQAVLAIGHGLFNRCIQAALLGKEIRDIPRMKNAEIRRIEFTCLPDWKEAGEDFVSAD